MKSNKDEELPLEPNRSEKSNTHLGRVILSSAMLRYEPIDLSTLSPTLPNEQMESKEYYTAYDKQDHSMVLSNAVQLLLCMAVME